MSVITPAVNLNSSLIQGTDLVSEGPDKIMEILTSFASLLGIPLNTDVARSLFEFDDDASANSVRQVIVRTLSDYASSENGFKIEMPSTNDYWQMIGINSGANSGAIEFQSASTEGGAWTWQFRINQDGTITSRTGSGPSGLTAAGLNVIHYTTSDMSPTDSVLSRQYALLSIPISVSTIFFECIGGGGGVYKPQATQFDANSAFTDGPFPGGGGSLIEAGYTISSMSSVYNDGTNYYFRVYVGGPGTNSATAPTNGINTLIRTHPSSGDITNPIITCPGGVKGNGSTADSAYIATSGIISSLSKRGQRGNNSIDISRTWFDGANQTYRGYLSCRGGPAPGRSAGVPYSDTTYIDTDFGCGGSTVIDVSNGLPIGTGGPEEGFVRVSWIGVE